MDDSSMFMQWAMNTLRHQQTAAAINNDDCIESTFPLLQVLPAGSDVAEMVQKRITEVPVNNWSSGGITDGSSGGNNLEPKAMDHDVWPGNPNSARRDPSRSGGGANPPLSWNFNASTQLGSNSIMKEDASSRILPDPVYGSRPTRRAGFKSAGSLFAQGHVIAERMRREKMNQSFIELSAIIPGLKKMDKATILSDTTRYVKELQEKVKNLEAGGRNGRSIETTVLFKRPCVRAGAVPDEGGSPLPSSSSTPATSEQLPDIEVWFSNNSTMVSVHCEDAKGVVAKVLTEVEELHLGIIHANVMPFLPRTLVMTITAKVEDGFTITAEEIIARLNSELTAPG
ncbi:unnamed protein product [Urochloa humidicola]